GEPPPEPTSTIGPASSPTTATARSASSSSIARASASPLIEVRPGVARTASSQSRRKDDDVAIRLRPFGGRLDAVELLQLQMHDLALDRGHRVELDSRATRTHLVRDADGERLEGRAAPLAIAGGVDDHL